MAAKKVSRIGSRRRRLGSPSSARVKITDDVLELLEELSRRTGVRNVADLLRFSVKEVGQVMSGEPTLVPDAPPRRRRVCVPERHKTVPEHVKAGNPGVRFRPASV